RRAWPPGPVRGVADRQSRRGSGTATRGDPHDPLVRSVHCLRDPHAGRRGQGSIAREGARLMTTMPACAVLGLGNVLMGDDGFGPFATRTFTSVFAPHADVAVIDAGTPGLDL